MNELLINLIPKLQEGFSMMLVGMGTVLLFLCIMIFAMFIMSAIVKRINEIYPEPVAVIPAAKKQAKNSDESEIAAAIIAAMFKKR